MMFLKCCLLKSHFRDMAISLTVQRTKLYGRPINFRFAIVMAPDLNRLSGVCVRADWKSHDSMANEFVSAGLPSPVTLWKMAEFDSL